MSDGWRIESTSKIVPAYRGGLRGIWDAIVAFAAGKPRLTVATPVTFSVYVKGGPIKLEISDAKATLAQSE